MTNKTINVLFIFEVRDELKDYLSKNLANIPNVVLIFPEKAEEKIFLHH